VIVPLEGVAAELTVVSIAKPANASTATIKRTFVRFNDFKNGEIECNREILRILVNRAVGIFFLLSDELW
jgi:hypothetical protein